MKYELTAFSHGAGCGCKLSPAVLSEIVQSDGDDFFADLLVGNTENDDAAVISFDEDWALISTTDFFMPIVDDAEDFGAIAATNALSDVYAMGGSPLMAVAILGWPVEKIPTSEAIKVMNGGRRICRAAGIPLAGGHSIDSPEPIFGLAVTGKVKKEWLKRNSTAREGDRLYLTKPLGIGAVTTAHKRKAADPRNLEDAVRSMTRLNSIGEKLAENPAVHAMTDVTGFGLGGHLLEMAKGSHLRAEIRYDLLPVFSFTDRYLSEGFIPGGTGRNWETYGNNIGLTFREQYRLIADPQTSGGLLIAVDPDAREQFEDTLVENGVPVHEIGHMLKREQHMKTVRVI